MKNPPQDDNIHKVFPAFSFAKKEEMSSQRQNDVFNEHAKYLVAKWTFNSDEENTKKLDKDC